MKTIAVNDAKKLFFGENTKVCIPQYVCTEYITEQIEKIKGSSAVGTECKSLTFSLGIPDDIKKAFENSINIDTTSSTESDDFINGVGKALFDLPRGLITEEEYVISFGVDTVVYAAEYRGFMLALSTLMYMSETDGYSEGLIYDAPACAHRGYRVYLPGRETYDDFIEMLDELVYYKYNRIMVEIGGAMEYKKHPRINEKWVEFSQYVLGDVKRANEIQLGQTWAKNSIHAGNGNGGFLTQDECKRLAHECEIRGLELIPECPTLSHTDYICNAYPEIAERQNDPYPDTYCPSNPRSYEITFDILDEVIDVFHPKAINIGHDEFYSICVCERCRGKDPARVFADDIIKIKEHLDSKGVETYMWGDKLLKARYFNGMKIGGWNDPETWSGVTSVVPWTYKCVDMLPKGITYLNWYWEYGEYLDDEYHAREFPVAFGNFRAIGCSNYRLRINRGVIGGYVSNWSTCHKEKMQRNCQHFNIVCSSYALWNDTYDSDKEAWLKEYTFNELYRKYCTTVKNSIKVIHGAHHSIPIKTFWSADMPLDSVYMLGSYEVTYTDGTRAYLPVKLGTNIASVNATERELKEASYSTLPIKEGDKYLFEHLYEVRHPEKEIKSISYIPEKGKEDILVEYSFPEA